MRALLSRLAGLLGATVILLSILSPASVLAMSAEQKKLYQGGVLYFDIDTCKAASASGSGGAASGGDTSGKVYMLGDSITVGTQGQLETALKNKGFSDTVFNAKVSRSLTEGSGDLNGMTVFENDKDQWKDANTIIIELGTNGGITADHVKKMMDTIKAGNTSGAKVYWVNIGADNLKRTSAALDTNTMNSQLQQSSSEGYGLIDWSSVVAAHPEYISGEDGIGVHPSNDGKEPFANTVADGATGGGTTPATTANPSCACSVGSSVPMVGSDNAEKVFNFFVGKGLQPFQAAGIIGNMMAESSVEPQRLQGTTGGTVTPADQVPAGTSLGWGLVQWTPASKMINPTKDAGKDPNDIGVQAEFLWDQLEGNGPIPEKAAGDALKAATDVRAAATAFELKYERHAGDPQPGRGDNAEGVLAQFGSNSGGTATGGTSACGGGGNGQVVGGYSLPVDRAIYDKNPEWFSKAHHGTEPAADIPVPEGTPVYSMADGKVVLAPVEGKCGTGVNVEVAPGVVFQYCHGSDGGAVDGAKVGDAVKAGQLIMHSSWTGEVDPAGPDGTHLHVGIYVDGEERCPQALFKSVADGAPIQDIKSLSKTGCTGA